MAGVGDLNFLPSPASGKLTVAAGTAGPGSFAPRRGKRRDARGRSAAAAKPAAAPAAPWRSRRTRSGASGAVTQGVQRHLWRWTGDGDAMAMAMVKVSFQL